MDTTSEIFNISKVCVHEAYVLNIMRDALQNCIVTKSGRVWLLLVDWLWFNMELVQLARIHVAGANGVAAGSSLVRAVQHTSQYYLGSTV